MVLFNCSMCFFTVCEFKNAIAIIFFIAIGLFGLLVPNDF